MAFIKTTLTDELTGKNVEICINTEYIVSLSPARNTTEITFTNGDKKLVDLSYDALTKFIGAKAKLD
jgi:predicted RNA-binding protein (virulence factor B family)